MDTHRMVRLALVALLFVAASSGHGLHAQSDRSNQAHATRGVGCEGCHGTRPQQEPVAMDICLSCHGTYEKLAAAGKDRSPNPHESHVGEIRCTLCHRIHGQSVLYCNKCHDFDLKVP